MTTAASSPSSPSSRPAEPKSAHDARTTQRSRVLIPRLASDSSGPARWAAMPVHSIGRCAGSQAAFPPRGTAAAQVPAFLRPFLAPAPIILPDALFVLHVAKHRAWPAFAVTAGGHFR
jgi:hypothetical protein